MVVRMRGVTGWCVWRRAVAAVCSPWVCVSGLGTAGSHLGKARGIGEHDGGLDGPTFAQEGELEPAIVAALRDELLVQHSGQE